MSVFILYNGHKHIAKVSPNKLIKQLLEEAIIAFKLDDDNNEYVLKHKKIVLNQCDSFRLANIPLHSTIDLVMVVQA